MVAIAIEVSARALAEFMTASPSTQRRIVRTAKYPRTPDAQALVAYYREARAAVERFFECGNKPAIIESEISKIAAAMIDASPSRKARLGQNIRAIQDFGKAGFAGQKYQVLPQHSSRLEIENLAVKVRPSLCASDSTGHQHWLHLDFSEGQLEARKAAIVLRLFLRAARADGERLEPRRSEYHHLHSRQYQFGQKFGAKLDKQIIASCQTFGDIWTSI